MTALLRGVGSLALVLGSIGVVVVFADLRTTGIPSHLLIGYGVGALLGILIASLPLFALARVLEQSDAQERLLVQMYRETRRHNAPTNGHEGIEQGRKSSYLGATSRGSERLKPLFQDDGGKPEPESYTPGQTRPKLF